MRLKNKRAIVTGGGTGIGRSITQRFSEEGARVLITARREDPLKETAEAFENVDYVAADLTTEEGLETIMNSAREKLGGLDILVNNSGVFDALPFEETSRETIEKELATNVEGLYRLTQLAIPELRKGHDANILNIGSILSMIGIPGTSIYAASKGAVTQITRSLAVEYGEEGIRCNCVCPGLIHTDLTDFMISDPQFCEDNLPAYPLGRFGETMDVAHACLFLVSEEASWLTGVILPVDGGYTAR